MHANQLLLRCYAKRTNEGKWYAMCIDLNVDAEADGIPDVKISLERAIIGYLETVIDADDRSSLETLLYRPSSRPHRLFYGIAKCLNKIRGVVNARWFVFHEPIPIRLALPC